MENRTRYTDTDLNIRNHFPSPVLREDERLEKRDLKKSEPIRNESHKPHNENED